MAWKKATPKTRISSDPIITKARHDYKRANRPNAAPAQLKCFD